MKVAIGADHGGILLKNEIGDLLREMNYDVVDLGCHSEESVDYPDYAEKVCAEIISGSADCGILVCGTGIGMSIAANRHRSIRAAVCHDEYTAAMSKEHNNANVIAIGARVVNSETGLKIVKTWLESEFGGGRHQLRIDKFSS